jgi:hypothetical protein
VLRLVYPDRFVRADLVESERSLHVDQATGYRALALEDSDPTHAVVDLARRVVGPGGTVIIASYLASGPGDRADPGGRVGLGRIADLVAGGEPTEPAGSGVTIRRIVRASTNPVEDCLEELRRSQVDVLLVPAQSAAAGRFLAEATSHVVLVAPGAEPSPAGPDRTGVVVVAQEGADGDTAFELGARMVMAAPAPEVLRLVPASDKERTWARRLASRAGDISLLRDAAEAVDTVPPGEVVIVALGGVLAAGPLRPSTVLAVRSADDAQRVGLDERIGRLSTQASVAAWVATRPPTSAVAERVNP